MIRAGRRAVSLIIVCLIVAGSVAYCRHTRDGFGNPSYWLLAMMSCVLAIPLKTDPGACIQKVLAAYLMALSVDYFAGVHWPLAGDIQIAAVLPVAAAAVMAAAIAPLRAPGGDGAGDLPIAAGVTVGVIAMLLLATGLLVRGGYGYGSERSLGVLGQLAVTLLVAMMGWRIADDVAEIGRASCRERV
jgi:hypothetical protein